MQHAALRALLHASDKRKQNLTIKQLVDEVSLSIFRNSSSSSLLVLFCLLFSFSKTLFKRSFYLILKHNLENFVSPIPNPNPDPISNLAHCNPFEIDFGKPLEANSFSMHVKVTIEIGVEA